MTSLKLTNASVLDVQTGGIAPDQTVVIENGRFVEISASRAGRAAERVIDCRGRIVMPGLCDAHVHLTAATPDFQALANWPASYVTARAGQLARDMLMRGFTTVRDAGGADFGLARAFHERLLLGPRLLFAGKALSQTGGHGDMREPADCGPGPDCCCCAGLGRVCDGVSEIRRACRDEIRKGATQIKLMLSGGIASPTDRLTSTQFSESEILAAVEEARAASIYCMGHAYTPRAIIRAVRCGVRSIEHGNYLDDEAAAAIKATGAFLVPTLATYRALGLEGREAGLPASMVDKIGDVFETGVKALEIAKRHGLPIVFGTDLLGSMQRRQPSEFEIRREVLSPLEIIQSATVTAAELFQMTGEIGVIAPGASADLLVLDGNPVDDISVLAAPDRHLHLLVQRGEIVRTLEA